MINLKSTQKKVSKAERRASNALNMFQRAYDNLHKANAAHEEAITEHDNAIQAHLTSQNKAKAHIESNRKVMDKLFEFLPSVK